MKVILLQDVKGQGKKFARKNNFYLRVWKKKKLLKTNKYYEEF